MSIIAKLLNERLYIVQSLIDSYEKGRREHEESISALDKRLQPLFNEQDEINKALDEQRASAQQEL